MFLATSLYGVALGGMFAVGFTLLRRKLRTGNDAYAALGLAAAGFVGIVLVPFLKYPPNPPAVGNPDTITRRTVTYLLTLVIGLLAVWAGVAASRWAARYGDLARLGGGVIAFLVTIVAAYLILPRINEVPETFPATLLWQFRFASLGTQATLWLLLGFGYAATVGPPAGPTEGGRRLTGLTLVAHALTPALRGLVLGGDAEPDPASVEAARELKLHSRCGVRRPRAGRRTHRRGARADPGRRVGPAGPRVRRLGRPWPGGVARGGSGAGVGVARASAHRDPGWRDRERRDRAGRGLARGSRSADRRSPYGRRRRPPRDGAGVVLYVLDAPAESLRHVDVRPLATVNLSHHAGYWSLAFH